MDDNWVIFRKDEAHVARERAKARVLRESAWWRAQLAKGRCSYCKRAVPAADLTMDHVVPVSRGGRSTKGNVVPSCPACNKGKKMLTPAEQILNELDCSDPRAESDPGPPLHECH